MTIVPYSETYFLDVVKLIENFHKEAVGEYDNLIQPEALIQTIKTHGQSGAFLMIVDGVAQGILSGIITKSMLNDRTIFQEVMWYVNEGFRGQGVKLLMEVEKLLKLQGVSIMIMAVLENSKTEKLKKLYTVMGYKLMESHFVRNLEG